MSIKKRIGVSLYEDIVLQYVEWSYLYKELTGISVTAFQVLCFLYHKVLVQSQSFQPCNLPYDHFTNPYKVIRGLKELTDAGLITRECKGRYKFNQAGNDFLTSFQITTGNRKTKLMHPLKPKDS